MKRTVESVYSETITIRIEGVYEQDEEVVEGTLRAAFEVAARTFRDYVAVNLPIKYPREVLNR